MLGSFLLLLLLVLVLEPPLKSPIPITGECCTSFGTPTWLVVQPLLDPDGVVVELASVVGVVGLLVVVVADSSLGSVGSVGPGGCP